MNNYNWKLGRNESCWCGSGKKYKACHLSFDEKLMQLEREGNQIPPHNIIKTKEQIEGIARSGKLNTALLDLVAANIKEGMSTEKINTLVHDYTVAHNAIPAPLGYKGFPKSVCTSINNEVCHGIPDKNKILKSGDIVNVDVTTILDGYYADASRMFLIGDVSEDAKKLVQVSKECLEIGFAAVRPWGYLGEVGKAVEAHALKNGCTVVENIGGHGVGVEFHEEPYVCHVAKKDLGMLLVPGMVITIEPMVNAGVSTVYQDSENGWTIYTDDGALSAQWEYTVAITEDGPVILTK